MLKIEFLYSEYDNIPKSLWKMLKSLDIITLNHSVRVCEICRVVEKEFKYKDNYLSFAGLFHDIGKFFISDKLLNKRGALDHIERAIINSHPYFSYKVLCFYNLPETICNLALFHHSFNPPMTFNDQDDNDTEFINISENIIKRTLVLKTIDVYEALTTDRPYHRGVSCDEAIKIIKDMNTDYDEATLRAIKKHHKEFE